MKLIDYIRTQEGGYSYAVKLKDTKEAAQYKDKYEEIINGLQDKKYYEPDDCWLISRYGFSQLQALDKELFFAPNGYNSPTVTIEKQEHDVTGWEDIGKNLKLPPYDYQKQVVRFCLQEPHMYSTLITAPCGAGKTLMGIAAYQEALKEGIIEGPGVIVVKASLKVQWGHEVRKFSDFKPSVLDTYKACVGSELSMLERRRTKYRKEKTQELKKEIERLEKEIEFKFNSMFDADLLIMNYETLRDDVVANKLLEIKPQFVFADEAHYIKTDTNKRSKALYQFNDAKIKIGATATPVQRDPRDIYGIFKFVQPQLFLRKTAFNNQYVRYGYGFRVIGAKNQKQLNREISPYMYILTKEEVSEQLPKLVVMQRHCSFYPKQEEVNRHFFEELKELAQEEKKLSQGKTPAQIEANERIQEISNATQARQTFLQELAVSEELLKGSNSQLAQKFITGEPDSKIETMLELVQEIISSGEKVVIFSRFASLQPILTEAIHSVKELANVGICYVRGELSGEQRYEEVYTKFQENDKYKILLCSESGSEGLNLSSCRYMIEMEPAVSYALQTQRHGRLERADSIHETVFVYQLIMDNSWDIVGQKIIEKKEKFDMEIVKGVDIV